MTSATAAQGRERTAWSWGALLRPEAAPAILFASLTAGAAIVLPAGGRHLPVVFAHGVILLYALLSPAWFRGWPRSHVSLHLGLAFVVWSYASAAFWSTDPQRSALSGAYLFLAVCAFVIFYTGYRSGAPDVFGRAIRVFAIIIALQILWVAAGVAIDVGTGKPALYLYYRYKDGIQTPLGGSNVLAIFLEFAIIYELITRRRRALLFAGFEFVALLVTVSRTGIAALFVTLLLGGIGAYVLRRETLMLRMTLAAAGAGVLVVKFTAVGQLLSSAFQLLQQSSSSRLQLWQSGLEAFARHPIAGIGAGAFEEVGGMRDAHSTPIELLSETGMLGLLLFSAMFVSFYSILARVGGDSNAPSWKRREAAAIGLGLFSVATHSLAEPFFTSAYSAIWFAGVAAWIAALPQAGLSEIRRGYV